MQKWAKIFTETGKAFANPSAMMKQIRKDSDSWSLPPLTIQCWPTLLVITKYPEMKMDPAQPLRTTPQPDCLHFSEETLPIRS